jgi:hypothetical protein
LIKQRHRWTKQRKNKRHTSSPPSTPLNSLPKYSLKAFLKTTLTAPTPATILTLELKYNPVVAIAISSLPTPAVTATNKEELAIPDAQPPKKMINEVKMLVLPRQKINRREKQSIAERLARMMGGLYRPVLWDLMSVKLFW